MVEDSKCKHLMFDLVLFRNVKSQYAYFDLIFLALQMSEYVKPNHRTILLEPDHTVCDATDKVRQQSSQMKVFLMYVCTS